MFNQGVPHWHTRNIIKVELITTCSLLFDRFLLIYPILYFSRTKEAIVLMTLTIYSAAGVWEWHNQTTIRSYWIDDSFSYGRVKMA